MGIQEADVDQPGWSPASPTLKLPEGGAMVEMGEATLGGRPDRDDADREDAHGGDKQTRESHGDTEDLEVQG